MNNPTNNPGEADAERVSDALPENPFQSPKEGSADSNASNALQRIARFRDRKSRTLWCLLAGAAVLESVWGWMLTQPNGQNSAIALVLYGGTPIVGLLIASIYPLRFPGSSIEYDILKVFLALLGAVSGYVCFGITCTVVNLGTNTIAIHGSPNQYNNLVFGIISGGSLFFASGVIAAICSAIMNRHVRR